MGDWVGKPNTLPALKTFASPNGRDEMSSTSYVSWNGATEVVSWEFFGSDERVGEYQSLGTISKAGFETSFISINAWKYTRVHAKDAKGNILGKSSPVETTGLKAVAGSLRQGSRSSDWNLVTVLESQTLTVFTFVLYGVLVTLVLGLIMRMSGVGVVGFRRLRRKFSIPSSHRRLSLGQPDEDNEPLVKKRVV